MGQAESTRDPVGVDEARVMVAEAEVRVIDIRDPDAYADYRIAGSDNLPDPNPDALGDELADSGRVLVVCGDGDRSADLADQLRDRGLDAISLAGGVEAWKSEGLPMQPSPDVEEGEREPPKLPGAGV